MKENALIRMANQIANNFAAYAPEVAVSKVAAHLGRYWEPRMLNDLRACLEADNSKIVPVVRDAIALHTKKH